MLKERVGSQNIQNQIPTHSQRKVLKEEEEINKDITISFVGDIKSNIQTLLKTIHCSVQSRSQIKKILHFYAEKIVKLRQQRNFYKQLLILKEEKQNQQILSLKQKVQTLEKQLLSYNKNNEQVCTCEHSRVSQEQSRGLSHANICYCFQSTQECQKVEIESQLSFNFWKEKVKKSNASQKPQENKLSKISNLQEQLLISNINELPAKDASLTLQNNQILTSRTEEQSKKVKTISQQQIMKMMLKYNLGTDDLEDILKSYEGVDASQQTHNKKSKVKKTQLKNSAQSKKQAGKSFKKLNASKCRNF